MRARHRWLVMLGAWVSATVPHYGGAQPTPTRPKFGIEIMPGHSLAGDGHGPYRDGEAGVAAHGQFALALCTNAERCSTLPEVAPRAASSRTLVLDLRRPVSASRSIPRGRSPAEQANFGAFWEQDTTARATYNGHDGWVMRSALDIPVGRTVTSQRVEIRFFREGTQYILQFGPWTAGQYQGDQGRLTGEGSTPATISRLSESTWVVSSAERSVGRLWDNRDPARPANLGLYEFTFEVRFTALSPGPTRP